MAQDQLELQSEFKASLCNSMRPGLKIKRIKRGWGCSSELEFFLEPLESIPKFQKIQTLKVSSYLLKATHGVIICVQESPKVKTPKKNIEALYVLGAFTGFCMFVPGDGHAVSKILNWK